MRIIRYSLSLFALMAVASLQFLPRDARSAEHAPSPNAQKNGQPVNVIFDTDMYGDIDDMLALAMLHTLADRGEIKLLAVTLSTEGKWPVPYVDLVNRYYGHGDIPIGSVRQGVTDQSTIQWFVNKGWEAGLPSPKGINYTQYVSELARGDGSAVYPHTLIDGGKADEAVSVLRRTLAGQPDRSVVLIQVGFSTNLARLLDSPPDSVSRLDGQALVRRKVRLLSAMAGQFGDIQAGEKTHPAGSPEFNLMLDVPAAQKLFAEWPTPIVASGTEIGAQMLFPQSSAERDFRYAERHPIAETYHYTAAHYRKGSKTPDAPHDHATFDLTSVLYVARPEHGYFSLSPPGRITVLSDGGSRFEASKDGAHRFLIITDTQRVRTLEAMAMLVSQPPVHGGVDR